MKVLFKKSPLHVTETSAELGELIELAIKVGTELGWFGDNGQEGAFRKRVVGELTLLEQRIQGDLGPDVAELDEALKDLVLRRQASSHDGNPPEPYSGSKAWHWDWRRTVAVWLGSGLVGILLLLFGAGPGWAIWAGLGAGTGLMILGPWRIANRIHDAGVCLGREIRGLGHWLIHGRRQRQLAKQLWEMEENIAAARLRRFEHDQWVEQHLAVLMGRFDLQRRRAEQAMKIVGITRVEHTEAGNYAQILHHNGNHDEQHQG